MSTKLSASIAEELLGILKSRFEKNMQRHKGVEWEKVELRLKENPKKLAVLNEMEITGGEPDVVVFDDKNDEIFFCDCAPESPKGRRSLCYDREAWLSRKEHKPKSSAVEMADEMEVEIINEEQYRHLQTLGEFDKKTSSWVKTPDDIRKLGGAVFCDRRFNHVFLYHNGAESYYGSRAFRGILKI